MPSGKTTIFRQLIFNIAIPTLLALLIVAVLNFQRTRSILVTSAEERNYLLSNEVTKILKFQDFTFELIEAELNNRLRTLNYALVDKYFVNTRNLEQID